MKIKQDPDPDPKLLRKSDPDKKNSFGSTTLVKYNLKAFYDILTKITLPVSL
jgi:hypothetical protein